MSDQETTATYDERLNLIDVDSASVYGDVVTRLEQGVGEPLYPGDERRIFAEALVPVLVAYVSKANDASRQTFLRYARGQALDAIGERLGVERMQPTPSECTIRFSLSAPQERTITIPSLTRVTSDGSIYWQTVESCAIAAGETEGLAGAQCTTPGEAGNGFAPGELSTLVDLAPYVSAVSNVDETHGGDDGEPYTEDGDDRFRERIRLAPNRLSTAGPEAAYRYWALSADADISDVSVVSEEHDDVIPCSVVAGKAFVGGDLLEPGETLLVDGSPDGFSWSYDRSLLSIDLEEPLASRDSVEVTVRRRMDGRVKVVPLMAGGLIPDENTLASVYEAVNAKDVRPMTDLVTVEAPSEVQYEIELSYWTTVEQESSVVEAVEGPGGAIDRYISEQCQVLGRDIEPDVLKTYVMESGAIRCDVVKPERTPVLDTQVAKFSGSLSTRHEIETKARWS